MKVCLDAGHSQAKNTGGDPGAVNGSYWESVAALSIVKKLANMFGNAGVQVFMTRTGGKPNLTLKERCRIANDNDVDCFISVHLNSADNKSASGIETLRYPKCGYVTKKLADSIQDKLVEAMEWKDRGVKERPNLYVLKHTKCPAVLAEVGFISNNEQCKELFEDYNQFKIAQAIFLATMKVFEAKYESTRTARIS